MFGRPLPLPALPTAAAPAGCVASQQRQPPASGSAPPLSRCVKRDACCLHRCRAARDAASVLCCCWEEAVRQCIKLTPPRLLSRSCHPPAQGQRRRLAHPPQAHPRHAGPPAAPSAAARLAPQPQAALRQLRSQYAARLSLYPAHPLLLRNYALLLLELGEAEEAEPLLLAACAACPDDAQLLAKAAAALWSPAVPTGSAAQLAKSIFRWQSLGSLGEGGAEAVPARAGAEAGRRATVASLERAFVGGVGGA